MKTRNIFNDILTEISKDARALELMTDEGKKELEKIVKEIDNLAVDIVKDMTLLNRLNETSLN